MKSSITLIAALLLLGTATPAPSYKDLAEAISKNCSGGAALCDKMVSEAVMLEARPTIEATDEFMKSVYLPWCTKHRGVKDWSNLGTAFPANIECYDGTKFWRVAPTP